MTYPTVQLAQDVKSTDVVFALADASAYTAMVADGTQVHFLVGGKEKVVAHAVSNGQLVVVRAVDLTLPQVWPAGTCLEFVKYTNPLDDTESVPAYRAFALNDCGGCGSCSTCNGTGGTGGTTITLPITGGDVTVSSTALGKFGSGGLQTALTQLEAYVVTVENAAVASGGVQTFSFDNTFFNNTGTATDPILQVNDNILAPGTYGEYTIDSYGRITAYTANVAGTIDTITTPDAYLDATLVGTDVTLTFIPHDFNTLTDVNAPAPAQGDMLFYTSTEWENLPMTWPNWLTPVYTPGTSWQLLSNLVLNDILDVDIVTPVEGDTLTYDAVGGVWTNTAGVAGIKLLGGGRITSAGAFTGGGVVVAAASSGAGLFTFTLAGVTAANIFVAHTSEGGQVLQQNKTLASVEYLDAGNTTTAVEIIVVGV